MVVAIYLALCYLTFDVVLICVHCALFHFLSRAACSACRKRFCLSVRLSIVTLFDVLVIDILVLSSPRRYKIPREGAKAGKRELRKGKRTGGVKGVGGEVEGVAPASVPKSVSSHIGSQTLIKPLGCATIHIG